MGGCSVGLPTPSALFPPSVALPLLRPAAGRGWCWGVPGASHRAKPVPRGSHSPPGHSALLPQPQAKELALLWSAPAGSTLRAIRRGAAGLAKPQAALKEGTHLSPCPRALPALAAPPPWGVPLLVLQGGLSRYVPTAQRAWQSPGAASSA